MSLTQAKQLRTRMTDAERRLWYHLRAHRFAGIKFKRQAPIGRYVADFVCFERKLIVEVDGGQHTTDADHERDTWLRSEGFQVLRFWNHDVLKRTDSVLEKILVTLDSEDRYPSPGALRAPPSPTGGEGTKQQTPSKS
jgi:very-short-patch-repair endonuclease